MDQMPVAEKFNADKLEDSQLLVTGSHRFQEKVRSQRVQIMVS
jgi:hypothetical protein